jgi:hypothetical protein
MKPGDLIEWVYKRGSQPVSERERIWSTLMKNWIPIGVHPAVLISITDEFYVWLNPNGLFHALVDDAHCLYEDNGVGVGVGCSTRVRITQISSSWHKTSIVVVPRIVGEHR